MWWGLCELKGVRALLVLTLPLIWMDGCVCAVTGGKISL